MSLSWNSEIGADRIYLPADPQYGDQRNEFKGVPIEQEVANYIEREFPIPPEESNKTVCYSIPKNFIQHGEKQGCQAEQITYERFNAIQLSDHLKDDSQKSRTLWQACFQGISYAGRLYRNKRDGRFMTKEHDLVVFNIYNGKYFVSLVEVKSTCDDPSSGYLVSDSIQIKNNKRSGQHQLRDHIEILNHINNVPENGLNCFLFWPFLTKWTNDPRGNRVRRWDKELDQHVFTDTLSSQESFNEWFYKSILCGKSIEKSYFDMLFNRFLILSCGIFVNEVHDGMLALLSQQQTSLLYRKPSEDGIPTVVHGAAGTGKTLLVLHKLNHLHECGLLNNKNRALYICYWQGIRTEFCQKLEKLKIADYVDTVIFHITQDGFLKNVKLKYRHIFMDECEAICLAFGEQIITNTFRNIDRCRLTDFDEEFYYRHINQDKTTLISAGYEYTIENDEIIKVNNNISLPTKLYGDLWYLVDINQATIFIPIYSPTILKQPHITLSRVMRNTKTIYQVFSQFYKNPNPKQATTTKLSDLYLRTIDVGHDIMGPPIYWVNTKNFTDNPMCPDLISTQTFNGFIQVMVDLYSSKGIQPHDLCALPFYTSEIYLAENINKAIKSVFVEKGYQPTAITDVEEFVKTSDKSKFLVPWVLRVKGLEFKVVIIIIEETDEFDYLDMEDRRKIYIMASRCTCLLILVSTESVKDAIDVYKVIQAYPFNVKF